MIKKNNLSNPTFMAEGDISSSQMVAVVLVGCWKFCCSMLQLTQFYGGLAL